MKSLRETLATSHVSAVAIAVLIFYSFDFLVRAFQDVLPPVVDFIATAVAVRGMPYISPGSSVLEQLRLLPVLYFFFATAMSLAFAQLVSRWVYGVGLFACLKRYRPMLARKHV